MNLKGKIGGVEVELQGCPWCGKIPTMEHWHGGGPQKQLVHCINDWCKVQPGVTGETPKLAIKAWNTRRRSD